MKRFIIATIARGFLLAAAMSLFAAGALISSQVPGSVAFCVTGFFCCLLMATGCGFGYEMLRLKAQVEERVQATHPPKMPPLTKVVPMVRTRPEGILRYSSNDPRARRKFGVEPRIEECP